MPALVRAASRARQDADALDALAGVHAARSIVAWGPVRAVRSDELAGLPAALATRVVRLLLAQVRGRAEGLGSAAVTAVLALGPGQAVHVAGGVLVTSGGGWLAAAPPDVVALPARPLAAGIVELGLVVGPGEASHLPFTGRMLSASLGELDGLTARAPRPGDRLRLRGGSRTVADTLVDAGVPRAARPLIPVVTADGDRPVWVAGVAVDAHATGRQVRLVSG